MKIAYMGVKGLPSKSGTERVVEAVIKQLVGKFEITVYCDAQYTPSETKYQGVRLIRIPTVKGRHLRPVLFDILSALHALFFGDFDIIHMHGVENCFTFPLLRLRYKVISTSHGTPGRMPISKWNRVERFFFQLAEYPFYYLSNCVTAISAMDTEYICSRYGRKVRYIPNGVDLDMPVDREAAITQLGKVGVSPHNFLLFAAGRIIERKGAHILMEAYKSLDLNIPIVIMGDLDQVPEYGQKLKEMGQDHRVIFMPAVAEPGLLFGLLELCRVFVFPSTSEGMSIMFLEAAALGIPMICSDIPENKSVVGDRALYFQSGDAADLANKIRWAIENPQQMADLAHSVKDWIRSNFSWERIASQYETLYWQLMRKKTRLHGEPDNTAFSSSNQNRI